MKSIKLNNEMKKRELKRSNKKIKEAPEWVIKSVNEAIEYEEKHHARKITSKEFERILKEI